MVMNNIFCFLQSGKHNLVCVSNDGNCEKSHLTNSFTYTITIFLFAGYYHETFANIFDLLPFRSTSSFSGLKTLEMKNKHAKTMSYIIRQSKEFC